MLFIKILILFFKRNEIADVEKDGAILKNLCKNSDYLCKKNDKNVRCKM